MSRALKQMADVTGRVTAIQLSQGLEIRAMTRYWVVLLCLTAMLLGASAYLLTITTKKFQEIELRCPKTK
jgi:hypothetical protein